MNKHETPNGREPTRGPAQPGQVPATGAKKDYEAPALTSEGMLSIHAGSINLWVKS
ncbi:MAG: hypothetical protein KatS3mg042_0250 [Rhodothermaceae bacterium]|nr:MAG: hypothetical protein KatS3mg042_0250 [Rhodothermaceae bacterium]